MEEEPALEPLASVIPRYGEPMECEDAASEHFQSDDAAFQQSGSPFSSTFDATALPGDIGHPSPLDPGLPDSQPTRNGVHVEREATMQSDEALQDGIAGMVPLGQGENTATAFERGGANLKGERAFRPTHASATCAYPRDALSELSLPRPLAQVMGRLGKDVRAMFELFSSSALRLALAGPVRACARSRTALPVPCMGPGLTAGLGRSSRTARAAARAGLPTHYRLLMPTSMRPI